jgi:hypothetical protein
MSTMLHHADTRTAATQRAAFGALLAVAALFATTSPGAAQSERGVVLAKATPSKLAFDIAMDGSSFHFQGPSNANGFPADGTPFVIRGYLYPAGTFEAHGSGSGTLADGSPEFPELVRGTWYCRGWHLQDGDATTGPVVTTTQIFDLKHGEPGTNTIVTDGIELADFDVWFSRAITGGSGRHRSLQGQQRQVYLALNASGGFNTSTEIRIDR